MKLKYVGVFGVVVLIVLGVFLLRRDNTQQSAVATGSPPSANSSPSKENVSKGVLTNIEQMKHTVEKAPSDAAGLFALARLLHDAHNGAEAADYYKRGLIADESNSNARIDYALCLSELGKATEALEQTRIVLKSEPDNPKACYNAGALFANIGSHDSAGWYWKKLIAAHPSDTLAVRAREYLGKISPASAAR